MQTANYQTQNISLVTRFLITGGVIGPVLLMVVILIEGAMRPGYNAWMMAGSSLSLTDQGWMQIVNFIVSGLLILSFAVGLWQALRGGRGGTWGPILIAAVGVALILAGIFVTDPSLGYPPGTPPGPAVHSTLHGLLHWYVGGLVVFSALPTACFVLARRFAADKQWRGWVVYSIVSAVLMLAFFVAFAFTSIHGGLAGLLERISLGFGMTWMVLVALRLLSLMCSSVSAVHSARSL